MAIIQCVEGQNRLIGDPPPAILGKFFDGAKGILDSLDNETVKFTPPNQLNDGWDCIPRCYKVKNIEEDREMIQLIHVAEASRNRDWGAFRDQLSKTIGIASFTDVSHCDLEWMWNRYGDQHRGALVIYDTSKMGNFIKVTYCSKRPCISIPDSTELFSYEDVIAVFQTKERDTNDHWEKESEWRKIDHLSNLNHKNTGKGVIYVKSYPSVVKRIVCGRNMDATLFQNIVKKAVSKGIPVEKEQVTPRQRT